MRKKKNSIHHSKAPISYDVTEPPFDTKALRHELKQFLGQQYTFDRKGKSRTRRLGSIKWGVYAFYDYENEPIYVGQTKENVGSRISRHLTNQRTDAVAMNVLDPFEVCYIEVWPLPHFEELKKREANTGLHDMEFAVYRKAIAASSFNAILNEKDPRRPSGPTPKLPSSIKGKITAGVEAQRSHPDVRIARRALVLARLAQVISERAVKLGLRRTLRTQANRLAWLADKRFKSLEQRGLKIEVEGEKAAHEDDGQD